MRRRSAPGDSSPPGNAEIGDSREERRLVDGPGEQPATESTMASAISASTSLWCSITSPKRPAASSCRNRSRQARGCQRLAQREMYPPIEIAVQIFAATVRTVSTMSADWDEIRERSRRPRPRSIATIADSQPRPLTSTFNAIPRSPAARGGPGRRRRTGSHGGEPGSEVGHQQPRSPRPDVELDHVDTRSPGCVEGCNRIRRSDRARTTVADQDGHRPAPGSLKAAFTLHKIPTLLRINGQAKNSRIASCVCFGASSCGTWPQSSSR